MANRPQDPRSCTTTTTDPKAKADGTIVPRSSERRGTWGPESFVFGTPDRYGEKEEHRLRDPASLEERCK